MSVRSLAAAVWLLICCILAGGAPGKKRKNDDDSNKVLLPHHSFQAPLEYVTLLDDWFVSGSSIFERERLLIHPGVPERQGFAWNKMPLLTNDFEVIVHFRVSGATSGEVPDDQSFGFFYAYENTSAGYNEQDMIKAESWKDGMQKQGFTLSGFKSEFEGIGAVLSMKDSAKKARPVVSFITNDGHTKLSYPHDLPASNAKNIDFRNTLNAAQLKIRVRPTQVEAHFKQSPSLSWQECFSIDRTKHPIRANGYIGFAAWSGSARAGQEADLVSVVELDVNNFDDTSIGEDMKDVSAKIQEAYREMLTDENRHFLDQQSQTEHLNRLTNMLTEHISSSKPAEDKLYGDVMLLQNRLDRLGEDCSTLRKEVQVLVSSSDPKADTHSAGVEAMKNEIVGLRRILVKDSASHRQKLAAVQKNIAEVKQKTAQSGSPEVLGILAKQTESLEKTVESRGNQMGYMLLCMCAAVFAIGWLIWNRMRYYEKKHFI